MKVEQVLLNGNTRVMLINPRYVSMAWPETCELLMVDMGENEYPMMVTQKSMDKLVAWMEANC